MVKVLGYNIQDGGAGRLATIAGVIRRQEPDAVALLEAIDRAGIAMRADDVGIRLAFGEASGGYHVAWLSRLPIRRSTNHRLAVLAKTLLEIEVDWAGAPRHLFATHLASRHDPRPPAAEIVAILGVLRPLADRPHLLVGDLNALHPDDRVGTPPAGTVKRGDAADGAPRQAIRQLLASGYVDCFRRLHPEAPGFTYPSAAPWLRLDDVYAAPCLAAWLSTCEVVAGG